MPKSQKGILWFLFSRFSFSLSAVVIREFPFSPLQFNFIRAFFVSVVLFPVIWFSRKRKPFRSHQPVLMTLRVVLASVGLMCFYYTFQTMTLAKAMTIASTQTFLTPVFAKIFLKEKVGIRRWLAISMGYLGIWIALDPIYSGIDFPEFIALVNVVLTATVNTMSKKLVHNDSPFLVMFYAGIASLLLVGIPWVTQPSWNLVLSLPTWPNMSLIMFLTLVCTLGPFGFFGQFGYLKAYTFADLSLLMPYEYFSFIFFTLLGYMFFDQIPATNVWVAMGIIIFGTTLLASYELRTARSYKKAQEKKRAV